MALLGKLEDFTAASTTHATEKGKLNSEATIALAKYVMDSRGRQGARKSSAAAADADQQRAAGVRRPRKLEELTAGTSKIERDAVIVVDKANAAAGKVRLNYLVDAASWRPQYKFRAGKDGEGPRAGGVPGRRHAADRRGLEQRRT